MTNSVYQPLQASGLCAERAAEVWAVVLDVYRDSGEKHAGSASGRTRLGDLVGGALLSRYLYAICPDPEFELATEDYLDRALAAVHRLPPHGLHAGVVGVGWLLAHVANLAGSKPEVADLDEALLSELEKPWQERYDLISGLVGVGFYGLERMPGEVGEAIVALVVDRLAEQRRGPTWFTPAEHLGGPQKELYPNGCHDLGLAHGVPGVVRLLSEALSRRVRAERAAELLEDAVPWLLSHIKDAGDRLSLPSAVESGAQPRSRLAWCYNELGAMTAVVAAGQAHNRSDWIERATGVLHSTIGIPLHSSGCNDASLCHGSAGVAHVYQCLAAWLDDAGFAAEAGRWIDVTLGKRQPGRGSGGYLYYVFDSQTRQADWEANASFLEGGAGIGLALLSAVWDLKPGWNRILGLS